ncbi:MAG TPA: RDD family protein [Verrucomicrobiae bacterium]|nr:RDD family protein [Verrucomicrobiae bacterium]
MRRYAGFWVRTLAWVIDSLILSVVYLFVAFVSHTPVAQLPNGLTDLLVALYFVVLWVTWGGTIGQRLLGLWVAPASGSFTSISYGTAVIRLFGLAIAFLALDLGVLWVGWDDRKQGWADKIAGTVVLHGRPDPVLASSRLPLGAPEDNPFVPGGGRRRS